MPVISNRDLERLIQRLRFEKECLDIAISNLEDIEIDRRHRAHDSLAGPPSGGIPAVRK